MEASMNQYLQIGNMMVSGAISKQLAQAIIEGNVQIVESLMTKGVKHELDRRGLKLAPIDILLALGAAESDLQRKFPIVALGYSWPDSGRDLVVPELWHNGSARVVNLNFVYPDDRWDGYYRFVALRK